MKNEVIISIIVVIVFVGFVILYFKHIDSEANSLYVQLGEKYPTCQVKDSVNDSVLKKYYPKNWRGGGFFQYITFENGSKMRFAIATGITSKDIYFGNIVKKGVKIMKNTGSDTLRVVTNKNTYLFQIDQEK
jgi:uncharacterized protein YxeA